MLSNWDVETKKCGLTIHSKESNIIAIVIKCCDEGAEQKYCSVPTTEVTAMAAKYSTIASRTIQHMRNVSNTCIVDGVVCCHPAKHGNRIRKV